MVYLCRDCGQKFKNGLSVSNRQTPHEEKAQKILCPICFSEDVIELR